MDIVRLGELGDTSYKPDLVVQKLSSKIWTERFQDPGEFSLITPDVATIKDLLPEGTLISHQETREVMKVETHSIAEDDDGNDQLTVTGRSLTCTPEDRWIAAPYQKKRSMLRPYSAAGAGLVLLWQAVNNDSGKDVTRAGDLNWSDKDVVPNVVITDSVTVYDPGRRRWFEEGVLYDQLMILLKSDNLGIRMVRPGGPVDTQLVHVQVSPIDDRGTVLRDHITTCNALRFDLYKGVDRSEEQTVRPVVKFSYLHGDVDKAAYLFSDKGFKTVAKVKSNFLVPDVYRDDMEDLTGLERRVMEYDGGDPEIPEEPQPPDELKSDATHAEKVERAHQMDLYLDAHAIWKNKRDDIVDDFITDTTHAALVALRATRKTALFSGDISIIAPYQYKRDYDLGDHVSLYGDYNETEEMVVTEYVRTEDSEGDRGYPGLTLPRDLNPTT